MHKKITKLLLANSTLLVMMGCISCNFHESANSCPRVEINSNNSGQYQELSIQSIAARNSYLNNEITDRLKIPWEQYNAAFISQPIRQLVARERDHREVKGTDANWIFSPDGQIAVAINETTTEPDNSLDIYNRLNNKAVEQLEFCGTPCAYLNTYWLGESCFALVSTVDLEFTSSSQAQGRILQISYYNLSENNIATYQSSISVY